jgi:hypothetical protein
MIHPSTHSRHTHSTGLGIFFSILAFSYLRQTLGASNAPRSGVFPAHYSAPYGASGYNPAYGQGYHNYSAPAGPPPGPYAGPDYGKPPGYSSGGEDVVDMQKRNEDNDRDVADPKTGDPRY